MQLLVYIMKRTEKLPAVLAGFMKAGISGTTVLDSEGALQVLDGGRENDVPALFGSLRRFLNPTGDPEKGVLVVLEDDMVEKAKAVIHKLVDIEKPDTGIVFTVPVSSVEGLSK